MLEEKLRKLREEIKNFAGECIREESKTHSGIYVLNKKNYIAFKKKYRFKPKRLLIEVYTEKINGKLCFTFPEIKDLDTAFYQYSNLNLRAALLNASLRKGTPIESFPFSGVVSTASYPLIRVEQNPDQNKPPYADCVYICEYGKYQMMFDSHSHIVARENSPL